MARGKLSGMQRSGMQRTSKREKEEEQERQQKQQTRQELPRSAATQGRAGKSAASAQKPERSTVDALHETIGLANEPEKLPNYTGNGQEPAKPENLPYSPAESTATTKPLSYSPYAGFAGEVRQFTDSATGSAEKKPGEQSASKPAEKSGFASFSQDEEADAGVEEQPDKPKQTAPANTALDDYLSEQEALRQASDPERQALESAAAEAQAAFDKLDSQDKTWWGPMDWDSYNRAQTAAGVAQRKLEQYDIAAGRGITASGLQAEAANAPEGFAPDPNTDWTEAAREKAKEELKDDRDALWKEYSELQQQIADGNFKPEDAERLEEMKTQLDEMNDQIATMQRADVDPAKAVGLGIYSGLEKGGYGVTQALDWLGGEKSLPWEVFKEVGTLFGADLEGKNPITKLKEKGKEEVAYWSGRAAEESAGNDTLENVTQHAESIAQSAPFIVLNLMTMGGAGGAGATTEGLEYISTLFESPGMQGISTMAAQGIKTLASNPSAQYSFATTFGSSYDEALEDGATPAEATMYAALNGVWNAMIEVGGSDEALGGMQALPANIQEAMVNGDRSALLDYIKSIAGEINEEEWQGFIERGLKSLYQDVALYSAEDPNAIINPATIWDTAKNTAIDTAFSAGGQTAIQYGLSQAGQQNAAPLDPTQVLAEQVTGQAAPVEGLSAEDQRAEQRAQRAAEAPAEVKAQADEVVDTLLGPMADAQEKADAAERVEEILATPTAEAAETPQETAELPGDIPAPPTAVESSTAQSEAFNREAPPARATTTAKAAADSLAESVGIEDRGGRLAAGLQEIADYIQSNNNGNGINEEELRAKAEKLAADTLDAIPGQETGDRELYDGIRSMLDGRGFEISDELRGDVADYNAWRKSLFGKLSLVKNGESIDTLYAELGTTFGKSLFPDDITSHADQINRIVDVLEGAKPRQTSFTDEVSQESYDEALAELTQQVLDSADGIESTVAALSDESLSSLEENAPPVTIDGTPVTPSTVQANGPTVERGFAENVRTTESTEEALAKSLGADKVTYERLLNKDVLAAAQGIYDQGFDSAKGYLDGVISAAKNGAKLPPEAVPLARMVANEMTRNGDVVGAERLIADVAAELTTAGQLGQVGKILRQSITTPEGKLYGMQKAVDKINEQADGKYTVELPQDLVEAYNSAESDEARDDIISQMQKAIAEQVPASWMEKWNALRYTAMLGNFKTQTRNIAGNLVSMVGRMAKDRVAAAMEYIGYLASGGQMERTKSVLYDPRLYAEARKDFANVQDEALGEGKYNDYQKQLGKEIEDKRRIFKSRVLEGWRRLTNWAMEQGDVIFSRANYADAMAGWLAAHNIKSLSDATPEQLDRARAYAIQQAQEATFRDSNDFSKTISGIGRNKADTKTGKVLQAVGEGIMPFRKTPANILVRAEEYSPLGAINTIADAVKAVKGKGGVTASDVIDQAAKTLTGSGIMLAGYLLAASGALRGKDRDKEQENFDKLRGEQDWSLTVGDTSYTLDWVSPYSIPLFMGAQLESLAAENGLSFGDVLNTFAAIGEPMLEMSMLDGLNDAFEVVQSYTDETPPLALLAMNSLASLLSQAAPTMLGQFERYGEDYRQSTYTDPNGVLPTSIQRKISQTMAKIPGFEALGIPDFDYQQQDYIDAWGRKQETPQGAQKVWETFFSPYYSSEDRSTPVDDELQRLYDGGAEKVFPEYASRNPGSDVGRLSPEEYETYATVKGQTSLALVQDFIESEEYRGLDDAERAEIIQNLYKLANNSAKTAVMRQREMIGGDEYAKDDTVTVLTEAGMDPADVASFLIDVSGDGTPKQEDLKAYFTEHPEAESYIAALWDAAGYTKGGEPNTWDMYKGGLTPGGVKALTDAGMKQEDADKLFSSVDTSGNGKATQEEIKAYYAEHPEDADYLKALWESMGWKTAWKP